MFSRWISKVKTSLSPKAWLAKHVAATLNDVFILDAQEDIESNLLTDTKIVLKHARVRPRQISQTAWLMGEVDEIEFSWIWGGSSDKKSTTTTSTSTATFVRDTRLTIRGANFRIVIGKELSPQEQAEAATTTTTATTTDCHSHPPTTAQTQQQKSSYIQRQIQQIVDHLTLDIADFTLLIQDHGCHSDNSLIGDIRVQAKSLQLLSFGRQQQQQHQEHDTSDTTDTDTDADTPTPPLSQRISLEAIKIDVLLQEQELPLLKPIGYAASVKRITGRRFLDGWRNGLQVVGESPDALVLHAGGVQLKTLCRLLKPLAAYDTAATVTPTNQEEEEDEGASTTITPTTITLPLPSVALILPEGTAVRIPQCTLLYHMDGSTSQLVGSEGVWIGDQPFLNFADTKTKDDKNGAHQENTKWKLDFVQRVVSLHQSSAFVEWNDTVVKQLVRECQQLKASVPQDIMEQVESTIYEYEETAVKTVLATTGDETNTTWRFESGTRASLGVRIRSDRGWAQASLESPALTITMNQKGALEKVQFEMGGAQFGPTSFGTKKSSIIRLPRLAFAHPLTPTSDPETIRIQECIDATIESQTVLSELQALGSDLLKFPGLQPEDGAKSSTASKASIGEATVADSLPPIAIAKVKLTLEAEGAKAQFGGVSVRFLSNGTTISSESLVCHILDRTAGECPEVEVLSVQNVAVQLGLSPGHAHLVTMQRLNRVHVPGLVDRMVVPLENVRLKYDSAQSKVQLDVPSLLHLALSPTVPSKGDTWAPAPPSSMQLPVSVQARFAKVQLSRGRVSMCIQPLQLSITSHGNGNAMTASLWGNGCTVRVQVDDQNSAENRWLEASVASNSKVTLSSMCEVEALECTGARILGTSCGQLDVSIPPLSYSIVDGQPRVQANGELTILLQSDSVAKEVQSLLEEAIGLDSEKECAAPSDEAGLSSIPPLWKQIEMVLPQAKAVVKEPMHLEGHAQNVCLRFNDARASTITVSIDGHAASYGPFSLRSTDASVTVAPGFHKATVFFGGASLSGPSGIALIMSDTRAELESPATAIVTGLVDSFVVPSMFELEEPTAGGTFSFTDGLIDITLAKLCGICPKLLGANTATSKADDDTTGALLACPIHVRVQELSLKATKESTASIVGASPVDILVVPAEGLMSVDADLGTNLRIVDSANGRWLQASISPISAVLEPSGMPSNASCSLIRIGPCSPGQLGISIPKFEMVSTAIKTDEVTGSFESFDVLQQVQALWHDCFPSESTSSPPFIWIIPKAIVSVESMKTRVVAEHVTFDSAMTGLSCSRLGWQDDGGVAAAFSGLHVEKKTVTGYHGVIATIDALYFPAFGTIGRPVQQKTMVSFDDDGLSIETPPVDVVIFEGEQQKVGQDLAPKSSAAGTIPFPVRLNLQRVNIRSFSENGEVTVLSQLAVHLRPQEQDPFAQNATQGAFFHLALTSAENKLLKLAKTTASGVVFPSDLATIHQFRLATGAAEVSVGLSSVDWASVFGNQKSQDAKKPIALPLCLVENFVAHLKYQGTIVGMQQTSVNVPALQGGPNTSSSDLVQHLKKAMLDRVPAMITNAAFLGENVSEMTAKTAGRVLLAASTATGSAAGSVVGLAAIDGIRGSVTAGKESRGAQTGEGYKFGDFSRGAIHSIRQAATSGAQTRRGESESYSVGDFTVGASKGAVKYAGQNKSRLGAAGGSGAGMIIGAAVAGPLGLVAGSIIGSKFGGAALGDSQTTEQSSPAESSASLGQPTATSNEVDLLGLPVSHQSQTTRTVVSPSMPMPHRPGVNPNFGSAGMANAPPSTTYQQAPVQHQPQQRQEQLKKGYRFGDFAKGVVAKGKEKSGRSGGDAYKFGDFSRGLFK